jgi:predicted oxidoreductase
LGNNRYWLLATSQRAIPSLGWFERSSAAVCS